MYGIGFSMREIIERYRRHTADVQSENPSVEQEQDMQVMLSFNLCQPTSIHCIDNTETKAYLILQHLQHETECLAKKIDYLEASKRYRNLYFKFEKCSIFFYCIIFPPSLNLNLNMHQEAFGGRFGSVCHGRVTTDRATAGEEREHHQS